MKKKKFLTNKEKQALRGKRAKMIIESFQKTYNKIKRVNENELNSHVFTDDMHEDFNQPKETLRDYLNRMGDNLPLNKYNKGDTVLMDMGDGSQEELTINKVVYHKPPKGEFNYGYYSEEYGDDMIFIEPMIIKKSR